MTLHLACSTRNTFYLFYDQVLMTFVCEQDLVRSMLLKSSGPSKVIL
jgi:hypothetical protein